MGAVAVKLTQKQRQWIEAMIQSAGDKRKAGLAIGCKTDRAADLIGQRMSNNEQVRQELARRQAEVIAQAQKRTGVSVDETLRELGRMVRLDPRRLFDEHGNVKDINELDDEVAACIAGVEVVEEFRGRGADREHVGYVKKLKFWDKNAAVSNAMKHLGLFREDNAQLRPVMPPIINVIGVKVGR